MQSLSTGHSAMEDKLARELQTARAGWEQAGARLRSVLHTSSGELNTSDGSFALHRASTAYRLSLQNYRECLQRYCESIASRNPPDE